LRVRLRIWLVVIGFVLLLPVIIPCAIVLVMVEEHRKRKSAGGFVCLTCGKVLGVESLKLSDEEQRKLAAERPDECMRRMVRTCHAICPSCGTRYTYVSEKRTFVPEELPAEV